MDQPKALPKLDHTRVTFYSFSGDPRPETICTQEEMSNAERQTDAAVEGFSVLMSTLRRSQVGTAAQTFATGRKFSTRKDEAARNARSNCIISGANNQTVHAKPVIDSNEALVADRDQGQVLSST